VVLSEADDLSAKTVAINDSSVRFSVVIPTIGRPELIARIVTNVCNCRPAPHEIVVVDGDPAGSAQQAVVGAVALLPERTTHVECIQSEVGASRQRNVGIAASTGDVVVFLDDDVVVPNDLFAKLAYEYQDTFVVGVTGRIVEPQAHRIGAPGSVLWRLLFAGVPQGRFTRFGFPNYVHSVSEPRDVEFMIGCFMSGRRDAAASVLFDESFRGYSIVEDEDFSCRLARVGRLRYVPSIIVEHRKTGFGSHDRRAFNRLIIVNRNYLFRKNFSQTPRARAEFVVFTMSLLGHRLVNREFSGVRGLIEGLAAIRRSRFTAQ
jgi:GT2 family glycosyltransferase